MCFVLLSWWRHLVQTCLAFLALCAGNSLVTDEFPSQRPVTRRFDVFFHLRLNKQLIKQWWRQWFETPARSLWRHSNVIYFDFLSVVDYWNLFNRINQSLQDGSPDNHNPKKCDSNSPVPDHSKIRQGFITVHTNRNALYVLQVRAHQARTEVAAKPLWIMGH